MALYSSRDNPPRDDRPQRKWGMTMTCRALAAFAVSALLAGPALAQTSHAAGKAPTQVPATPVAGANVSLNQLLAAGYQVRAVNVLSGPVRQEIYKSSTVAPQVMVTLQKAGSVAVCVAAAVNWMNQATVTRENKALCHRD